ncbi:transmembrane protein 179B-like isoform X2 [Sardina pilchardus]|uniref:transmembrane protein 179B-like isoform X2 n=1 Tax=Sardina pilchardus TaxID=27697 RepID=UPI002E158275
MDPLLVLQVVLYVTCFICGIVTAVLVTIVQAQHDGKCLLFGTLLYNNTTETISVTSSGDPSVCNFAMAVPVCVTVLCFSLVCYSCVCGQGSGGRLCANITLGMSGLLMFLLIISGCVLKIGRDKLCESLPLPQFNRCEDAQTAQWDVSKSGSRFYSLLLSAEISVWVNFFCLLFVGGLAMAQRSTGTSSGGARRCHRGGRGRSRPRSTLQSSCPTASLGYGATLPAGWSKRSAN